MDLHPPEARPAGVTFAQADAHALPFAAGAFDAVALHFALLWIERPSEALAELRRVLAPDGVVLLLAEPDLRARRDEPDTGLGAVLQEAVRRRGGHPAAGAEAGRWLETAGFRTDLRVTERDWVPVGNLEETLHELDSLREAGLLDEARARTIAEAERAAAGRRRVLLPVTYGAAWKR